MFLKARKGVVKLALQHGTPIVPVITFGLRKAFTAYIPKGSFWASVGRKIGYLTNAFIHTLFIYEDKNIESICQILLFECALR